MSLPTSAGMDAWDIAAGMEMRLFTLPKLTVILKSLVTCCRYNRRKKENRIRKEEDALIKQKQRRHKTAVILKRLVVACCRVDVIKKAKQISTNNEVV